MWTRFKHWLIRKLGGTLPHDCKAELWQTFSVDVQSAVVRSCQKVEADASSFVGVSNLGRNIRRDEACEWAKLYLKDAGIAYRDSDINLACELWWHVYGGRR